MASSDAQTLIKAIRDQSKGDFKVITGGKHFKVIHGTGTKKGRSVVDEDGPLIISGSPSEARNRELAVHRLMRANVLKFDPWKGPERKDGRKTAEEILQEQKEGRRLRQQMAANERDERSNELRSKVELLLVKIGGSWSKYGFTSEFARTILYWLKEDRDSDYGMGQDGFTQSLRQLGKGNTVSENVANVIEMFVDHVNAQINPRSYYMHLVGLAKEAKPTRKLPVPVAQRVSANGEVEKVLIPDPADVKLPDRAPSVWDFISLAALHERSGLKWSMGLTIDEYAELQRAVGYLEALVATTDKERGEKSLKVLSDFLIKMAEARFYTMAHRDDEADNHA